MNYYNKHTISTYSVQFKLSSQIKSFQGFLGNFCLQSISRQDNYDSIRGVLH